MADDSALDLEELRKLQGIAKRPRVLSLISSEISNLEKLPKAAPSVPTAQVPAPVSSNSQQLPKAAPSVPTAQVPAPVSVTKAPALTTPALNYITLGSFSWDQDSDKIKIYVFLEAVEQDKVETVFKEKSADIKFHDVQGKNYRCAIPNLNKEIVPEKSKVVVKPNKVIITLFKASKGNWLDLHSKEDKFKPSNLDKEKDPMAGIMDLMKNMYEDGDEEMKRTIAKAWSDARSGKTADPLQGYR